MSVAARHHLELDPPVASRRGRPGCVSACGPDGSPPSSRDASGLGAGGVIGGRVLLRLAPDAVAALAKDRDVLLVSGTNGKTTTSALLTAALRSAMPTDTQRRRRQHPGRPGQTLASGRRRPWCWRPTRAGCPGRSSRRDPRPWCCSTSPATSCTGTTRSVAWPTAGDSALTQVDLVVANAEDPDVVCAALAARRQVWVAAGQRWVAGRHDLSALRPAVPARRGHLELRVRTAPPRPGLVGRGRRARLARRRASRCGLGLPGESTGSTPRWRRPRPGPAGSGRGRGGGRCGRSPTVAGRYAVRELPGSAGAADARQEPRGLAGDDPPGRRGGAPAGARLQLRRRRRPRPVVALRRVVQPLAGRRIIVVGRRATDLLVRLEMDGLTRSSGAATWSARWPTLPPGPVDVIANYTAFQDADAS